MLRVSRGPAAPRRCHCWHRLFRASPRRKTSPRRTREPPNIRRPKRRPFSPLSQAVKSSPRGVPTHDGLSEWAYPTSQVGGVCCYIYYYRLTDSQLRMISDLIRPFPPTSSCADSTGRRPLGSLLWSSYSPFTEGIRNTPSLPNFSGCATLGLWTHPSP